MIRTVFSIVSVSLLLPAAMAGAATVTSPVTATVVNGELAGLSVTGSLTYDDINVPNGIFGPLDDETLALSFEVGPFLLTEQDDTGYPVYPLLTFFGSDLVSIDYEVYSAAFAPYGVKGFYFLPFPDGLDDAEMLTASDAGAGYNVNVYVDYLAPVPLPAGLPLLIGGLGVLGLIGRRRRF